MKTAPFKLTREKHLDHMVRVVPLIVMGYAIQCYILMKISESMGLSGVFFLGACLIAMIALFLTYDSQHQVNFYPDHLEIKFLFMKKSISYTEILNVSVSESKQTFASIRVSTAKHATVFYFVDEADQIKAYLDEMAEPKPLSAAA